MAYFLKKKGIAVGDGGGNQATTDPTRAPRSLPGAIKAAPGASGEAGDGTATGWVNLQTYMGLNQGSGKQMATGLADTVEKKGQTFKQGLGTMQNTFNSDANAQAMGRQDIAKKSLSEMSGYGTMAEDANKIGQEAKGLINFGTRQATLQEQQAKAGGDYNQGMGKYDSFLAGAAGGETLRKTADEYGGLSDALGLANKESQEYAAGQQTRAEGLRSQDQTEADTAAALKAASDKEAADQQALNDTRTIQDTPIDQDDMRYLQTQLEAMESGQTGRSSMTEEELKAYIDGKYGAGRYDIYKRRQRGDAQVESR